MNSEPQGDKVAEELRAINERLEELVEAVKAIALRPAEIVEVQDGGGVTGVVGAVQLPAAKLPLRRLDYLSLEGAQQLLRVRKVFKNLYIADPLFCARKMGSGYVPNSAAMASKTLASQLKLCTVLFFDTAKTWVGRENTPDVIAKDMGFIMRVAHIPFDPYTAPQTEGMDTLVKEVKTSLSKGPCVLCCPPQYMIAKLVACCFLIHEGVSERRAARHMEALSPMTEPPKFGEVPFFDSCKNMWKLVVMRNLMSHFFTGGDLDVEAVERRYRITNQWTPNTAEDLQRLVERTNVLRNSSPVVSQKSEKKRGRPPLQGREKKAAHVELKQRMEEVKEKRAEEQSSTLKKRRRVPCADSPPLRRSKRINKHF